MKQDKKITANLYGIKYDVATNDGNYFIKYGKDWFEALEVDGYLRISVDRAIVDFDIETMTEENYLINLIEGFGDYYSNYKNIDPPKSLPTIIREYLKTASPQAKEEMKQDTSNTVQHTPGKLFSHDNTVMVEIGGDTWHVAECWSALARAKGENGKEEAKANAERICKAWNEYDQLQEQNKELREALQQLLDFAPHKMMKIKEWELDAVTNAKKALNNK